MKFFTAVGIAALTPLIALVLLVCLKLADVINWPWLWILCPVWIPAAIIALGAIFGMLHFCWWRITHRDEFNNIKAKVEEAKK